MSWEYMVYGMGLLLHEKRARTAFKDELSALITIICAHHGFENILFIESLINYNLGCNHVSDVITSFEAPIPYVEELYFRLIKLLR